MGNTSGNQENGYLPSRSMPSHETWLQNQTFRIKGQSYTLLYRQRGERYGSVWVSITPDGRRAAVKVFDLQRGVNSPSLASTFQQEVKMTYKLRDAKNHVVNIYGFDFDKQNHVALIAMELGDDSLEQRVEKLHFDYGRSGMIGEDYISPRDRKNIWIQLVNILLTLYQHNVVHRDIKPTTLVFFGPIMKVVDLGIAQNDRAGHKARMLNGLKSFNAPEYVRGEGPVTSKADIWSAGAVLYYLTYGVPPISLSSQPPPGVQQTRCTFAQEVLYHCLQKNPNQRASYQWLAQHPLTISPSNA